MFNLPIGNKEARERDRIPQPTNQVVTQEGGGQEIRAGGDGQPIRQCPTETVGGAGGTQAEVPETIEQDPAVSGPRYRAAQDPQ
jgi:hypothetical protein